MSQHEIVATMSSREIAQLTGKEHKNVLSDCDRLNQSYDKLSMAKILAVNYRAENGQLYRELLLTKIQTIDLMTGYNVELRIKVNRRWEELESERKAIDFSNPDTVLQLAQNWARERKCREAAEEKLRIAEPKAMFADAVAHSESAILVNAMAKILNQKGVDIGGIRLFEWMRDNGYLCRVGRNNNVPTQKAMNMGLFEISETAIARTDGTFTAITPYVTGKGQVYFVNKFLSKN